MGIYKNIVDGLEIEENVNVFDERQKKSRVFFDIFIKSLYKRVKMSTLNFKSDSKKLSENYLKFEFQNKNYFINIVYLKNSGIFGNSNKRFQVKKKLFEDNSINSYFALLNIGEETLFFITSDISEFIKRYKNNSNKKDQSYSSYWVSYEDICNFVLKNTNIEFFVDHKGTIFSKNLEVLIDAYLSGNVITNKKNVIENFEDIENDDFFDYVKLIEESIEDFDQKNIMSVDYNNKLKRDSKIVSDFLIANQFCRACSTKSTFTKKNELIQYFEVHHFIPYNNKTQMNFIKTLDSKINLVTLCPNCHKKIHLSSKEEQEKLIRDIAEKIVTDEFKDVYPEYNIEKLIKWYQDLFKRG
ncbi:HNH endonuclease signature motif containing protein [Spiroplasma endosymbiont of Diplazon laetatorius]|uniref:HNH endonuclease signature motif containing protein n=1 Tax=Spiroplasma endosymbiont of Diplazon laetatorius TaxID=3066322 RepID=UPI0030CE4419